MNYRALLLVMFLATPAYAQELPDVPKFKLDDIPAGPDRYTSLPKGEPAPYAGQLFDPPTALRWANWLEQYRVGIELCETTQRQLQDISTGYWQARLVVEEKAATEVKVDLQQRVQRLEEQNARLRGELSKGPPWYNTRTFGVVLGVVGTSALVITGAVVVGSVK